MVVGTEWVIDAAGCDPEALGNVDLLRTLFSRILTELNLQALSAAQWHKFPEPGGVTGFVLLTESHLACHTYPEFGVMTINLYCCQLRPTWPWAERLAEVLGATRVSVQVVTRSAPQADGAQAISIAAGSEL